MRSVRRRLLLELGDDLLDRAAGHELHEDEVDEQDAEERRDDQQQAAEDVGAHQAGSRPDGRCRMIEAETAAPFLIMLGQRSAPSAFSLSYFAWSNHQVASPRA